MGREIKALGLFSGGLDSRIAVKLMLEQGIEVATVKFTSPFLPDPECEEAKKGARELGVPLKIVELGEKYLEVIKSPKYGYGKNLNPCIDCRIFMFKKAKEIAQEEEADFIFTGEVLQERPMTQHKKSLQRIERESGLEGKIVRSLSAQLLPETEPEKENLVEREKLLDIQGRRRKKQIKLAEKYDLSYPQPAGGCLLTYEGFSTKVKDLFQYKEEVSMEDISLLRIGRHFRYKGKKIIVGNNEEENEELVKRKKEEDYLFEVPDVGSPITILKGEKTKDALKTAARLTVRYSDAKEEAKVKYGRKRRGKEIEVRPVKGKELEELRVA